MDFRAWDEVEVLGQYDTWHRGRVELANTHLGWLTVYFYRTRMSATIKDLSTVRKVHLPYDIHR